MPTFLPDETLYSLCARFHHLSGNRLAATTSHQLFGVSTAAMLHDFPTHLATFQARTEGKLGDVESLARARTLLRFYAPYQPAKRIIAGIEAMAGNGIDHLKFRLGLPSSRIGATHPLKACAKCIQEELDQIGCAYWHLQMQHPSVWICTRHNEFLMQTSGKSRTQNKLQWILPHTLNQEEWKCIPETFKAQSLLFERLHEFARGTCTIDAQLDPTTLRQCYLYGAKKSGWLTRSGSVRLKATRQAFLDQVVGLVGVPEFDFIESADRQDGGFLGKLLRSARSYLHPTKHLIVKIFLFGSWAEFWTSYLEMDGKSPKLAVKPYSSSKSETKMEALLSLVAAGQTSLAQIARDLELPYDVARYWLKRAGVLYIPPKISASGSNH